MLLLTAMMEPFCIAVPQNNQFLEYYTRDGAFKLDSVGRLVTRDGHAVMGQNGQIILNGSDFTITYRGEVIKTEKLLTP